jgi:2-phosphosulfolactate phosphatase
MEAAQEGARRAGERGDVCIIVDALRASTTISVALAAGAEHVNPVRELPADAPSPTAGERDGRKLDHADHGNSPAELSQVDLRGQFLTLSTTNGTRCIEACAAPDAKVLVGALVNASAVAACARELAQFRSASVSIVLAGRRGEVEEDDLIAGAAIWDRLDPVQPEPPRLVSEETLQKRFLSCEPAQRRFEGGKGADVEFSSKIDHLRVVPEYNDGLLRSRSPNEMK